MKNNEIFRSVWVRLGLGVLGYAAVLAILTWLAHAYWIFQHAKFGDALFGMGVLACLIASAGMMRNSSSGVWPSPAGMSALPIQSTEEEKHTQLIADFVEQQSFGVRLLAAGLLTVLLSIIVSNIK